MPRAPGQFVYEEFLDGSEHSVEGFLQRGRMRIAAITDKTTDGNSFLEIQHTQPTRLPAAGVAAIERLTALVVQTYGLDECTFHL